MNISLCPLMSLRSIFSCVVLIIVQRLAQIYVTLRSTSGEELAQKAGLGPPRSAHVRRSSISLHQYGADGCVERFNLAGRLAIAARAVRTLLLVSSLHANSSLAVTGA